MKVFILPRISIALVLTLLKIPIWFQAIKGATRIKSGVMTLPLIVSYVIFSFGTGSLTSVLGYYVQWAYLTVILSAVGTGLLTTLKVDSGHAEWIGYQVLFGAGVGCGMQAAFSAPQTALPLEDIPVGTPIVMFMENLASAVMVSVAQNVFTNQLKTYLGEYVHAIDAGAIVSAGATELQRQVPEDNTRRSCLLITRLWIRPSTLVLRCLTWGL